MYNILVYSQKKKIGRDYFNRKYIPKKLRVKIIRTPFESSYKFTYGALNRSCRINKVHERQRMSAVLLTMDFADHPPLDDFTFAYKKHSTDKSLCYVFGAEDGIRTHTRINHWRLRPARLPVPPPPQKLLQFTKFACVCQLFWRCARNFYSLIVMRDLSVFSHGAGVFR